VASNVQRSLAHLRQEGYDVWVVERFIRGANKRQDLFGLFDVLAIKPNEILGVQCCSASGLAAHRRKMQESLYLAKWAAAGGLSVIHSWRKVKGRWKLKVEEL
jgi:hypothetical protein